ncbi:MAG: hypothetical protein RL292_94 [Candidatus Parcubacteria bacterium]|jgi:REP element-mobilizing transposase RayT
MTTRKENFVEGEYYHIYNRGNSKQIIFLDDDDRERFVKLLYLCNSRKNIRFREDIVEQKIDAFDFDRGEKIVSIGAWVLMPNHFHIYITPRPGLGVDEDNTSITNFVQKLSTAYSMYFNKKYKRTGSLYEGRFKSTHVKSDEQAKYNFSYIHLNPVKLIDSLWRENGIQDIKKALEFLDTYMWSSYLDYKGVQRSENKIISPEDFPDYFSDKKVFEEEIFDWLNYGNE